ncbi:hypothetical protein [Demequina sp. SO4-18]|uniref:hypothetical protein n=1 Tax=Demequina sp. SO4-18 TaxID=3401026 RepID=UPI003B5C8333
MAEKKHNKRKFAALALALVGVAGLSVASAATLNVEASNEVAIGTETFAACDTAVAVDYTYDTDDFTIKDVTVDGISDTCDGEGIRVVIEEFGAAEGDAPLAVVTGQLDASGSFTKAVTESIDIATDLGLVTVVIG